MGRRASAVQVIFSAAVAHTEKPAGRAAAT